jgi:acyl-CoA thioesterase-2
MPAAPAPEGLPDWEDLRFRILGDPAARRPDGPLEVRECDGEAAVPAVGRPARRALWIRPRGVLPEEPLVHAAVLAFATDRGLLSTAGRPHGLMWGVRQGASLDHAVWLHGPVRFDGWTLFTSESPVAVAGRGLVLAAVHARDGVRLASVAQEGLIRVAR